MGFAGRQSPAAGFQLGVETVLQRVDPIGQPQVEQNLHDGLIGRVRIEEGQVVAHAGPEQLHVLGNHAHPMPEVVGIGIPSGEPSEHHPSVDGIVEPGQQPGQSCFTAAGSPQNTNHPSGRHVERDIVENGLADVFIAIPVGEGDSIELHRKRAGWQE